RAFAWLPNVS
ncbi:hypothetical protein D049_5216B, partial [Vibrio parahaemolyticus VPTS-2010]